MTWLLVLFEFETPDVVASTIAARNLIDGYILEMNHVCLPFLSSLFHPRRKGDVYTS